MFSKIYSSREEREHETFWEERGSLRALEIPLLHLGETLTWLENHDMIL